jgi:hypothetical protein
MDEQTAVAESSAATETEVATPSLEVPRSGPEYDNWRKTGALPEKKQPEPAASATAPSEDAVDSATTTTQESRRKPDVEARFKKLTDELKAVRTELEEARRPKTTQAESSPALVKPAQPQTYKDWFKAFDAEKWMSDFATANPDKSFERGTAEMADHLADVRDQFRQAEERQRASMAELSTKLTDARQRYGEKYDEVVIPTRDAILGGKVAPVIHQLIQESDVLTDLLYTLGENQEDWNKFLGMQPGKQARYIAILEHGISEKLANNKDAGRNDRGQFTRTESEAPAKRGPESAPEPPIEIGSRGSGPMDESARALKEVERGNSKQFRAWKEAEDRKELAKRRGA